MAFFRPYTGHRPKVPLAELQLLADTWSGLRSAERSEPLALALLRRRRAVAALARFLFDLPLARVEVSDTPVGADVRNRLFEGRDEPVVHDRLLANPVRYLRTAALRRVAVGVLEVPKTEQLSVYANRHTLRKGLRRAKRDGVYTREIIDPEEQINTISTVFHLKQPGWGSEELKRSSGRIRAGVSKTFAAFSEDGTPLAVTVATVDSPWAYLRMSASTGDPRASAARHALHLCVVKALADAGCRFCMTDCLLSMPPGLRELQYLLDFSPRHLRV